MLGTLIATVAEPLLQILSDHTTASVLATTLLILLVLAKNLSHDVPGNLPPGPKPWPLIGNLHLLAGKKMHVVFKGLSEKYGDIFTIHIGTARVVVLNSYEVMREALHKQGDDFAARPLADRFKGIFPANSGVLTSEGDIWRDNRRFALSHLRDLGFGKQSLEPSVNQEVDMFLTAMRSEAEKRDGVVDVRSLLGNAVSNVINRLIFGKRYDYEDKEFRRFLKMLDYMVSIPEIYSLLPFGKICPVIRRHLAKRHSYITELKSVIIKHYQEHQKSFNQTKSTGDDLMNAYLQGKYGLVDTSKASSVIFEDEHISKLGFDFFVAGTESTSTTLRWAILYMITYPDVQNKVRAEISAVIGARKPSYSDKDAMPYTQAVLTEIQRLGNVIYMSVPHKPTCNAIFRGYSIPEGTVVIPNLAAVHMDERNFPSPNTFRPERFLDSKGQFDKLLAENVIPFGIGKRLCLGQSLAKMELFIFLTSMIQQYVFKIPDGVTAPSLDGSAALINSPKPYEVSISSVNLGNNNLIE